MKSHIITLFIIVSFSTSICCTSQTTTHRIVSYNVENLFDCENDSITNDDEFTPESGRHWTHKKYETKLAKIAKVLAAVGEGTPPSLVALCEVENAKVLDDLTLHSPLRNLNYKYIHYDSPDRRGIDVALLYQRTLFKPLHSATIKVTFPTEPNTTTRDILYVKGTFLRHDTLHLFICHFPSRLGGELESEHKRLAAAQTLKLHTDSIMHSTNAPKIIIMGDFNDYPDSKSVMNYLRASGDMKDLRDGEFFNPMYDLHKKGYGTNFYRDAPGVLDQMILTPALLPTGYDTYQFKNAKVHNKEFLKQHGGKYNGYPFRTFGSGVWMGGYSDHFPVYVILLKKA